MKILYIGQPTTDRAATWTRFLDEHGHSTTTTSVADIGSIDFSDVDLAIVDGEGYDAPQPPDELQLQDLPRPTVLVAGIGGKVSDAIGLKLGWQFGCLCLNHQAIITEDSRAHPIFHGPHPVPQISTERIDVPEMLRTMERTMDIPDALEVATVYEPTAQEIADGAMPGLVSTSSGFLDSPDCEHILGGINSKAPGYNAVARQGRFLQWGFAGEPTRFTDLGRALFLNALEYVATFAEAPVEALVMQQHPRVMLHHTLGILDRPEIPDALGYVRSQFGGTAPLGIGTTSESSLRWYQENAGYLRFTGTGSDGRYSIDEDLVTLGVANDDPALLELLAADLDRDDTTGKVARRLWTRYLRREVADVDEERAWFTEHRGRLFFSDWAGYRWIARDDLPVFQVPRLRTAEAGNAYLWLSASRDGSRIDVSVHIALRPGDYVYAPGASDGVPTTVEVVSEHQVLIPASFPEAAQHHLPGHVVIPLAVTGENDTVEVSVRLQVCNAQSCTIPMTASLSAMAGAEN